MWQGGEPVAEVEGDLAAAHREAMHYAILYAGDGPACTIKGYEDGDLDLVKGL